VQSTHCTSLPGLNHFVHGRLLSWKASEDPSVEPESERQGQKQRKASELTRPNGFDPSQNTGWALHEDPSIKLNGRPIQIDPSLEPESEKSQNQKQ
jgi:hypothetical protein